jgi:hypothetical protein
MDSRASPRPRLPSPEIMTRTTRTDPDGHYVVRVRTTGTDRTHIYGMGPSRSLSRLSFHHDTSDSCPGRCSARGGPGTVTPLKALTDPGVTHAGALQGWVPRQEPPGAS